MGKDTDFSSEEVTMEADLWSLYRQMLRSRLFEEKVMELWDAGQISGEMHLDLGEEAIVAGVVSHLQEGDAMALDHRGTPPLVMRGMDLVSLLRELLGQKDGLCGGWGGHMHLFSQELLAASSGIVGATGPMGAGFALSAQNLRPHNIAVAFFGEGAVNQGMVMESLNLAVAWNLPVLFVCKDNELSITTYSPSVTGGNILERVRSFGMETYEADGTTGTVPDRWNPIPLGKTAILRGGKDLTLVSLGVGVHRCLEAALVLEKKGASACVIDLRTLAPLDRDTVVANVSESGRMLVADEDYKNFGLSGELAATVMETGILAKFRRVCTETTIPYSRRLEDETLPSTEKILDAAFALLEE